MWLARDCSMHKKIKSQFTWSDTIQVPHDTQYTVDTPVHTLARIRMPAYCRDMRTVYPIYRCAGMAQNTAMELRGEEAECGPQQHARARKPCDCIHSGQRSGVTSVSVCESRVLQTARYNIGCWSVCHYARHGKRGSAV